MPHPPTTAEDVFDLRGIAVFVAALAHHDAITAEDARAALARPADRDLAVRLGRRLVDRLGDGIGGESWWKYEISEIGYNFDVTAFGYGDEAMARRWEALCEQDNAAAYLTRLPTMEALAAGLLGADAPGARFVELIARWEAHRARDAELQARDEAWRAAFRAARRAGKAHP